MDALAAMHAVTAPGPAHPPTAMGAPTAVPDQGHPLTAVSRAAAEGGASACRAFCSEIALDGDSAPETVQLFPAGPSLRAVDGRRWRLSDPEEVARRTYEASGDVNLVVDWEHAQDRRAPLGERADAAGWIKSVVVREGTLMARVEWTPEGRKSIEEKAYRYISPTFAHTVEIGPGGNLDGGDVLHVTGAGLVNRPAFDMPALAGQQEETVMKKILVALGLPVGSSEEQGVAAIAAIKSERDTAVSEAAADPPITKFVPRADYDSALARTSVAETKLASQATASRDAEIKTALDAAQGAGRITPATRAYHEAQCRAEGGLERFREFVAAAPAIADPTDLDGSPPQGGGGTSGAQAKRVAAMFGHTPEFVRKHASPQPTGDS